jgi:hypothetical protein
VEALNIAAAAETISNATPNEMARARIGKSDAFAIDMTKPMNGIPIVNK